MPRRRLPNRMFLTSSQIDDAKALVGGSPFAGDRSSTGIRVPTTASTVQNARYMFLVCAATVPAGHIGIIRSLHQLLYIGTELEEEHEQPDAKWLIEIPVTDPMWCFPDGNVSWHLRTGNMGTPDTKVFFDNVFPPPYSSRRDTTSPALLARTPVGGGYVPLNAGIPYGKDLAGLGTFRDMRFPWNEDDMDLGIEVPGSTVVALYASVYQTDPDRRPNKPVGIETAGLRPEDVFVLNYPQARYTRVGARMKIDIVKLTKEQLKGCG